MEIRKQWRAPRRLLGLALAGIGTATLVACGNDDDTAAPATLQLEVLSSRPDLVTGGDALVAVTPSGAGPVGLKLNGADTAIALHQDPVHPSRLLGIVTGLKDGDNVVEARQGAASGRLTLTNYPSTGPVISGPHETPFVCTTQDFVLPDGSKLGVPLDSHCSAARVVQYVYRTTGTPAAFQPLPPGGRPADLASTTTMDGRTVPYIVRVETGTTNRAIYQMAILHDPNSEPEPGPAAPPAGWNRKLVYPLGGGCQGGWYTQGLFMLTPPGSAAPSALLNVIDDAYLRKGYGVASSTLNIFANNCNDLLSSETTMMVKERFVESYGVPTYTVGTGGSGGAYQSMQTAQNYPGLFDGIITTASFPDPTTGFVTLADVRLLDIYFNRTRAGQYSAAKQRAISGMRQPNNIVTLSTSMVTSAVRLDPRVAFSWTNTFPQALRYDPVTNPGGARATPYDHTVNVYGRRAGSLFAKRPLDNVGVQYGLKALNEGVIGVDEFLDLNEQIGGLDLDFNQIPQRTIADVDAIERAYRSGRIVQGGGGLATTPIITQPGYDEGSAPNGGIHLKFWSFSIRERMIAANGTAANQVIVGPRVVTDDRFEQMDRWLMAIRGDGSNAPLSQKVVTHRPADVVDACWDGSGNKIVEEQTAFGSGRCNTLYPTDSAPNMVAGAPLASDIIKCELKPIQLSDYVPLLSAQQQARLMAIFPQGVCDWSRPGVGRADLKVWASVGPSPVNQIFDVSRP